MATFTVFANTSDGRIASADTVYANAANGAGTSTVDTTATSLAVGQIFGTPTYTCFEAFLNFDTSGVSGTVTSAILSMSILIVQDGGVGFTFEARQKTWDATVDAADWVTPANLASQTLLATLTSAGRVINTRYDFTDVAMASAIVVGGQTQIMINSSLHRALTAPIGSERDFFYSADDTGGATTQPRLVITTTDPPPTISAALSGTATSSITETDLVTGAKTIILTLSGTTWIA